MFKKPVVFTDFHHSSLLYSLILLFEKRLGGTVFRPIGYDWYDQGYWKVLDLPGTVKQYLDIGNSSQYKMGRFTDGIYVCEDSGFSNKAITLESFYKIPVDIVIASIPAHLEPFKRLCKNHPNKPKLIYQIGNTWTIEAGLAPNIMASAVIKNVPKDIHFISYHQEFDLSIFSPDFSYPLQNIYSFVNCFPSADGYAEDWKLFESVEKLMKDWSFKSYGGVCRDGNATGPKDLAERMKESRFIWHTKNGGDGYGHVIYNSAAVARPMIVKTAYYQDKMGKELMVDGKTCVAIDGLSPSEIVQKIEYYSERNRYKTMCRNVFENFKVKVDFEKEGKLLNNFIKKLV